MVVVNAAGSLQEFLVTPTTCVDLCGITGLLPALEDLGTLLVCMIDTLGVLAEQAGCVQLTPRVLPLLTPTCG